MKNYLKKVKMNLNLTLPHTKTDQLHLNFLATQMNKK